MQFLMSGADRTMLSANWRAWGHGLWQAVSMEKVTWSFVMTAGRIRLRQVAEEMSLLGAILSC